MSDKPSSEGKTEQSDRKRQVFLVDDHAIVRFGINQLINREPDMVVCGEEEVAGRALDAILRLRPDISIVDISLKDSSGLELIRNLKAQLPSMPTLVVSAQDEQTYADVAFRAGAMGYLSKQSDLGNVIVAIRRVLNGNLYVSEMVANRMLQQQIRGKPALPDSPIRMLSDRELEVFEMLGRWKKTGEIANELHLSVKTIEYYREQIKRKLSLTNSADLTRRATAWVEKKQQP